MTNIQTPEPVQPVATEEGALFALVIETRFGTDVTIHRTHDGAHTKVDAFVNDWWAEEMRDEPMPENPTEAREAYFEAAQDESYTIVETAIID